MCDNMSKVFFEELELPQVDIYLGVENEQKDVATW